LCALAIGPAYGWSQALVHVYVQAGAGDFAANGAGDSALDLRKALLGKSRTLQVVDNASEADVVVRIDSRNVHKETAGVNTYETQSKNGRSTTATSVPAVRITNELHVTVLAGNSQIPLETGNLSWRLAAGDMASSIDHWVKENYAKLIERRAPQGQSAKAPQDSVPSPAAPAAKPSEEASITPGMSESQVLGAMGGPEKKVIYGKKSLWNYRGMQVVFEDSKVTDVKF